MNFRHTILTAVLSSALILAAAEQPAHSQSGIIDLDGNVIVPPEFSEIKAVGKDKFLLTKLSAREMYKTNLTSETERDAHKLKVYESSILVDLNGKVIDDPIKRREAGIEVGLVKFPLPSNLKLVQYAGKQYKIVQYQGKDLYGVIGTDQKVIVPVKWGYLEYLGDDMFLASTKRGNAPDKRQFLLHKNTTVKEVPYWIRLSGRFEKGAIRIANKFNAILTKSGEIKYLPRRDTQPPFKAKTIDRRVYLIAIQEFPRPVTRKFGIKDKSGNWVVPAEYESIVAAKRDFFILRKRRRISLFDLRTGSLVQFPELVREFGRTEIDRDAPIICYFTNKSRTWTDSSTYKIGYCDLNGKIIVEPQYRWGTKFYGNRAIVGLSENTKPKNLFGIIDTAGNWVVKPKYKHLYERIENRLIATLPDENSDEKPKKEPVFNRPGFKDFSKLLNNYNFVGMTIEELERLIGHPDTPETRNEFSDDGTTMAKYRLSSGCTGSTILAFQINPDKIVTGWRCYFNQYGQSAAPVWLRENVGVIQPGLQRCAGNLVPKSDLESVRKALGN